MGLRATGDQCLPVTHEDQLRRSWDDLRRHVSCKPVEWVHAVYVCVPDHIRQIKAKLKFPSTKQTFDFHSSDRRSKDIWIRTLPENQPRYRRVMTTKPWFGSFVSWLIIIRRIFYWRGLLNLWLCKSESLSCSRKRARWWWWWCWCFLAGGNPSASQIPKQKRLSVKQRAFESICAELNRPSGKGILQGKGSSLLYDCADVNGIIRILAASLLPALWTCSLSLSVAGRRENPAWNWTPSKPNNNWSGGWNSTKPHGTHLLGRQSSQVTDWHVFGKSLYIYSAEGEILLGCRPVKLELIPGEISAQMIIGCTVYVKRKKGKKKSKVT